MIHRVSMFPMASDAVGPAIAATSRSDGEQASTPALQDTHDDSTVVETTFKLRVLRSSNAEVELVQIVLERRRRDAFIR